MEEFNFDIDNDFLGNVMTTLRGQGAAATLPRSSVKRALTPTTPDDAAHGEEACAPVKKTRVAVTRTSKVISRVGRERRSPRPVLEAVELAAEVQRNGNSGDEGLESSIGPDEDVLSVLYPNLDMSTALSTASRMIHPQMMSRIPTTESDHHIVIRNLMAPEPINMVPKFYSYTVKACLLPIRKVQNELVFLFFEQIHPMFPVVDELYLTQLHCRFKNQEELMSPSDFMIYHAIMVAAFAHLSELQLLKTPYRSVHEGQEAQFDQVKARYFSGVTANPAVLTQVCLLLSLWSPGNTDYNNNSYWLDQAFKHAIEGELWDLEKSEFQPSRNRLLWWCCLVRDRLLALGMRRPYRLHEISYGRDMITEEDFGFEAQNPSFTDLKQKQAAMLGFIWFCKLSDIMATIAIFQRQNKFSRAWKGEDVVESSVELDEVVTIDRSLDQWRKDFEAAVVEEIGECSEVPIPITTLRIISFSLVSILYQPYLHLSWLGHQLTSMPVDPLQKVKDGAKGVALNVALLLDNNTSDTIPVWLVAWVALPAAVYHVSQQIRQSAKLQDTVLHPFLRRLMRRSTGAEIVENLFVKATEDIVSKLDMVTIADNEDDDSTSSFEEVVDGHGGGGRGGKDVKGMAGGGNVELLLRAENPALRVREAKVLAGVTRTLDMGFELNGTGRTVP